MTEPQLLSPALSASDVRQIVQVCDRFEAAWKAGRRPDVGEYAADAAGPARPALLRQLLLLDWDYRRRAGDHPRAADYHSRFPGDAALIDDVGREIVESSDNTRMKSDRAGAGDTPWPGDGGPDGGGETVPAADADAARYDLEGEVGHGGIGVVFRGRDRRLGRALAVKVLRDDHRDRLDARRRFVEEARVASRLQHPAIVPIYELGRFADGRPFITMKLVEGHTLAALLRDRADPGRDLPRFVGVFEQVCQAMAYAHANGVVHRDLKPANVMVGTFGEVQVMDWGFAKIVAGGGQQAAGSQAEKPASLPAACCPLPAHQTHSGALMGTPAYMPPEQARGDAGLIDRRADVFALGAILCEILTGRPPYTGGSPDDVCRRAAAGDLADAYARLDACAADAALRDLAKGCLAADPADRPPDAGAVAQDLTAHLATAQERLRQAQLERAAAEATATAERRVRRLSLALAAAAVVVVTLAGAGWWWRAGVRQAEALRVAAADARVEAALAEAAGHVDRSDWRRATAALTRARELHDSGASDQWTGRLDECQADLDLIAAIDDARVAQGLFDICRQQFHREEALPRYAAAFTCYGVRVGGDPAEAAARIAGRPAPVRDAIVVGLDNWWLVAQGRDAAAHDWLGAVLRAVDPDPLRARIRRAAADRDRRALDELARSDELARQPPTTVASLTWALLELGAYDTVIALLRPAQQRHPDDVWINLDLAQALDLRRPPNYAEALRFFSIVRSLRPETRLQVNLGYLLLKQQDWDGLVTVSRESIALTPPPDPRPLAMAYNHLGIGLARKGELEQAEAAFRKALELNPDFGPAYYNLGRTFHLGRRMDEALAAYERAVQLVSPPNAAAAQGHVPYQAEEQAGLYLSLGQVRYSRKEYAAALAAFDKAIELHPGYAMAHFWRADTLHELRRPDDSIAAYEQAVRYDPTMERAYYNMGVALQGKGRLDKAIAAYSRAIAITPKADSHYNMAKALRYSGDEAGSEAAYRKAIELNPKLAPAHWSLGALLVEEGRFAEALPCLERGCQCRAAADGPEIAEKWVNQARRFVELEAKLPRILDGSDRPATPGERLEYASVCRRKRLDAAAARFYADYLAERPAAADSLEAGHRYLAATVAARAGTGQGHDAAGLDDADRARWRRQALDWLRADLALWTARVDGPPAGRSSARAALQRWRDDKALAGVREPQELAKLPEPERAGYVRFWADVQEVLVRSLAVRPEK